MKRKKNHFVVCSLAMSVALGVSAAVPVWPSGRERDMNGHFRFRAAVAVPTATNGVLTATAGYAYRAKVNGRFVGYGPARTVPGFFRLDEWPIALAAGTNAVELEVVGYNCNNFYLPDQTPFVQAEIRVGDRVLAKTARDGAFVAYEAGRVRKAPRFCYQRAFAEIYRLPETRTAPLPLAEQPARKLLPREWAYPDFHLTAPFVAVSTETVVRNENVKLDTPRCLIQSSPGYKIFPLDELEENPHYDLQRLKTVSRRAGASVREGWHALAPNAGVVFEAPREYAGFPRFRARCRVPVTLYFTFDEFLQPDGSVDNFRAETLGAVVWHLAPGEYELEGFEPVAFKCARILAIGGAAEVTAPAVRSYVSPTADRATFRASDSEYEKIFAAAKASYAANAVDCLTDCPIRERAGWLGDSFFTGRASHWLTGSGANERLFLGNYLRPATFGSAPAFAGLVPAVWPCDLMTTDCFIPNYDMWFVLELEDYVRRTGDKKLAEDFRPRVMGLIEALDRHLNADGLLERLPGWVFVEWSHANELVRDVNYPSNMLYAEALSAAARLYGVAAWTERAAKMRQTIRRQSLTAEGWYCDNAVRQQDGSLKLSGERTEVCQYYAFFTGVATKERDATLWGRLVRDFGPERIRNAKWDDGGNLWKRLSTPIREGVWKEIWPANMIFGTCLRMELLSRDGRSAQVAREMREHFLPMAEKTGTLWEHGDPRASCCHGFAAIAAEYVYRDILGLRAIDRRRKTVAFRPPQGVDLSWCEATVPLTATETANLGWRKGQDGVPVPQVRLPAGWRVAPQAEAPDWSGVFIAGRTAEGKCFYAPNETMTFELALTACAPTGTWFVAWKRTGDDGLCRTGRAPLPCAQQPLHVTTSLSKPGFVRLEAWVEDAQGRPVSAPRNLHGRVFFDGGAGVSPERLAPPPEPAGFDAWWRRHLGALADVPVNPRLREVPSGRSDVKAYAFAVDCPNGLVCTGWVAIPAARGKYPLRVRFFGYNESWSPRATALRKPSEMSERAIRVWVSPHGVEMNRDAAYYEAERQRVSAGYKGHAWSPVENASPDTSYFAKMAWRVFRGLEWAKSLPEWDGRHLVVDGGSQGALQAVWAAAWDPSVSEARVSIVWNCDAWGKAKEGRLIGDWALPWAEGLRWFDAVSHARRIPASCRVDVEFAGLGDYISPPSGIAALYNVLRGPKSIRWVQGGEHGWSPKWPGVQRFEFSAVGK